MVRRQLTCDSQTILKIGLNVHLCQPRIDLRASSMNEDRLDTHTGQKHKVLDDPSFQRGIFHGCTPVFHHDSAAAKLLKVR